MGISTMTLADRTLAERAREMADERVTSFPATWAAQTEPLLRALADENDTQRADAATDHLLIVGYHTTNEQLRAERDRYWNLAEQLNDALINARANYWTAEPAMAAFRAEKDSRDV